MTYIFVRADMDVVYCPFCDCTVVDEGDLDQDDPRCPHCGGELHGIDPDPVYDTLEEKYL
jgi:uncharacterized protein with PIN domain